MLCVISSTKFGFDCQSHARGAIRSCQSAVRRRLSQVGIDVTTSAMKEIGCEEAEQLFATPSTWPSRSKREP
jgi:hypothetical protein